MGSIYDEAERKLVIILSQVEKAVLKALDKGLTPEVFNEVNHRDFYDLLKRYYMKYHVMPKPEEFTLFAQTAAETNENQRERISLFFQELLAEELPDTEAEVLIDAVIRVYKTKKSRDLAMTLSKDQSEDNIDATLDKMISGYTRLKNMGTTGELISDYKTNNSERMARYDLVKARKQDTGLLYCFPTLNRITGGQDSQTLWVVRGGPKAGKSMTLINMANHVVKQGKNIIYFSAEVNRNTIENRLDALNTGLPITAIKKATLEPDEEAKLKNWYSHPDPKRGSFIIVDKGNMTTESIRATVRDYKTQMPIHLVVVDYLGLIKMPVKMEAKWIEVGEVAKELRALAKEEDLPVLTAQQTNKQGDTANAQEIDRTCDMLFDVSRDNPDEDTLAGATVQITAKMIYSRDSGLGEFAMEASFSHAVVREVITEFQV